MSASCQLAGSGGRDELAQQDEFLGPVHPDQARQDPGAAEVHGQRPFHEDLAELCPVGGDDEVAGQGEVHASADGRTVHGGDRGHRDAVQGQACLADDPHVVEVAAAVAVGREVGAGAEGPASAGDHYCAVAAGVHVAQEVTEHLPAPRGHRVPASGAVEGDRHDSSVAVHQESRYGYVPLPVRRGNQHTSVIFQF
jgi:hypothetical protein